jgi:dTDP-4-amino-4,6-dideoxygalactose transaminase
MNDRPAILGGDPTFPSPLPFAQPTIEEPERVLTSIDASLRSGWLTDGPRGEELEDRISEALGVEHCIAVSSCTAGLMLVIRALGITGTVGLPSFTFSATAHAVSWNGLPIRFLDCDPGTWCLTPDDVTGDLAAIVAVHISGVPCDVEGLTRLARDRGVPLVFDAAHGTGSMVATADGSRPLGGFGSAEVFSLTPTKVLNGAEGGLVTTNDAELARLVRIGRNYGNPGDYDTRFAGLNARLSELHAAVVLAGLDYLEARVGRRTEIADRYRAGMGAVPGVSFQAPRRGDRPSWKDFTILVDEAAFGCSRDLVVEALAAEGVATRKYYSPPVHRQQAYVSTPTGPLPVTDRLAARVISLPMSSHLSDDAVDGISEAVHRIQSHAEEIARNRAGK